jgi:cell division protein FtsL
MATARVPRSVVAPLPRRELPDSHLRLVPAARRRLAVRLSPRTGVLLTLLLFVALFGVAVSHALLIEGQARLDELDKQVAAEQQRYERLRLEQAELEAPDRIVAEAAEMGMVPAGEVTWLTSEEAPPGAAPPATDDSTETSDTSWADVKPYMEPTP